MLISSIAKSKRLQIRSGHSDIETESSYGLMDQTAAAARQKSNQLLIHYLLYKNQLSLLWHKLDQTSYRPVKN